MGYYNKLSLNDNLPFLGEFSASLAEWQSQISKGAFHINLQFTIHFSMDLATASNSLFTIHNSLFYSRTHNSRTGARRAVAECPW